METAIIGRERLRNDELLAAAEDEGFEVFITSDKNLRCQQNFSGRAIALVILGQGQWPAIRPYVGRVRDAVNAAQAGGFVEVDIPFPFPKGHRMR